MALAVAVTLAGPAAGDAALAAAGSSPATQTPAPASKPTPPPAPAVDEARIKSLLKSADDALTQHNYGAAVDRYRQFIREYPSRKECGSARYHLGRALLELPRQDFNAAIEALTPAAADAALPQRPEALFLLATAERAVGLSRRDEATGKPEAEAKKLHEQATTLLESAQQKFGISAALYGARVTGPEPASPPPDLEWSIRARCDQADLLCDTGRFKEASLVLQPLLKSASLLKSQWRTLATYQAGRAALGQGEGLLAGRLLSSLAPFNQPLIGLRARYLLGSVHEMQSERPEAEANFSAVVAQLDPERKQVEALLRNPGAFRDRPEERVRAELFMRDTAGMIPAALFQLGQILQGEQRYADAIARYQAFLQHNPLPAQQARTRLQMGACFVLNQQAPNAMGVLGGLQDDPTIGDQALLWQARATVGMANAADPNAVRQAATTSLALLQRAAAKAAAIPGDTPALRQRRGEVLTDLGAAHMQLQQFKEAAAVFAKVVTDGSPDQNEAALAGQATALGLAGMTAESETACRACLAAWPHGSRAPEMYFRLAEDALYTALTAPGAPADPARKALFVEAGKRYQDFLSRYPEDPSSSAGRFGLGSTRCHLGDYAGAVEALKLIPEAERTGPLATTDYLLGDALLRTLPPMGDDAISLNRALEQIEEASKLLTQFVASNEHAPQLPDALLKLGMACQKNGSALADPAEQKKSYDAARQAYDRIIRQFPQHPAFPSAVYEQARLLAAMGDLNNAVGQLARFQQDPLKNSAIAPEALLAMGQYMLRQHRAAEAATVLGAARQAFEGRLASDPSRAGLLAQLQITHGLALKESGKSAEAIAIFENAAKAFAQRPEGAEAAWRLSQAQRDDLAGKALAAYHALVAARGNAQQLPAAQQAFDLAMGGLRATGDAFVKQAKELEKADAPLERQARMLGEAATTYRDVGEIELAQVKEKLEHEGIARIAARINAEKPALQPPPVPRAPELKLSLIPLTPGESRMLDLCQGLFDDMGDTHAAGDVRSELIDFCIARELWPKALTLLGEQMDRTIAPGAADPLRLRVADCLQRKGDPARALQILDPILQNRQHPLRPAAIAIAGNCYAAQGDWSRVMERLSRYRDVPQYTNLPGISDRGLLQLARGFMHANQWPNARQTLETLLQRFGNGPYALEARFDLGTSLEQMGQIDAAIGRYTEVSKHERSELSARAELHIGLCRLKQNRYGDALPVLLRVIYSYDYPELTAAARLAASRALEANKQAADAKAMVQRVLAEHPSGPLNAAAQKRLAEIK